jgi:class 3 adenylate cyclase/tetratricopeptide (TPR) repeat protein
MQCPRCQHENPPQANFCLECGARFAAACAQCGTQLPAGAKFCVECGKPTGRDGAEPARFASAQSYTPKHLAEKILTSKAALEGERKQVTVLFADLKGSMELLADRDPEEARKILDPVLAHMMDAVHRYEGTVNQVMGDGIMALFGAPLAHEDHAVRACYAALRMQESVKRYAGEVHRTEGVPIQIRVGLNSGEVVVRSIGSDLHMDYTAVGQTTHVAARLQQMSMPGSVLISPETLALAEGYIMVKPLGTRPTKGLERPLEVYELIGAATVRSRFQAATARGLTRFVGRKSELDQLHQALERARASHGQVVAVVGEPGVGKSRLYWEFSHSHRAQGWLILESGSVSYGKATNYLPIIELLRAYFAIEHADDTRKIREKVTGKLLSLDWQLEPCLSPILWLLDVPSEDEQWARLDPPQRCQRILDAVKRLLLRESQVQPLMVLFEDLHWIDSETQAALDSLVASLSAARILLLVNYRPEYRHAWGSTSYFSELRIHALPSESTAELLGALLGEHPTLQPLKPLLIERAEGNPLFLEESVRTLVETKALAGERGAYRLAQPLQSLQIPASVQAVVAARIDRLSAEDKQLLQAASVIGKDVPFALLQAIVEGSDEDQRHGLGHLIAADFLYEASLFSDLEYTFKHALTHEVAYGSLLQERRRGLHVLIVAAIERLYANRLAEQVERLAHHAVRGELWEKAVPYLRQAGAKAASRSAHREAVICFERALEALHHLPQTRERLEQAVDLRFDMRNSLVPLGELGSIRDALRESETVATALGDQRRCGWVAGYMTHYFWLTGDEERAVESSQRALALAQTVGDFGLGVLANFYLGVAHHAMSDYGHAIEFFTTTVASLQGELVRETFGLAGLPAVMARSLLITCLAERGEFGAGIALADEALQIAEEIDQPYSLISACSCVGFRSLRQGELQQAIAILERGLGLVGARNIRGLFSWTASPLGYAYALSGRLAEAVALLEKAVEHTVAMKSMLLHSLWIGWLGEAYLRAGRTHDAARLAERALELSRDRRERGHCAYALRLLGEIASQLDRLDIEMAEGRYGEAVALATALGMRPLVAHCHLGFGKLYWRTGQREQAREHLTTATTMYREMDMRFYLEQAEAEMRELVGG